MAYYRVVIFGTLGGGLICNGLKLGYNFFKLEISFLYRLDYVIGIYMVGNVYYIINIKLIK